MAVQFAAIELDGAAASTGNVSCIESPCIKVIDYWAENV